MRSNFEPEQLKEAKCSGYEMKISVFGLGYVGTVAAGCLASEGHTVIGVDTSQTKVDLINKGQSPVIEKDIGEILFSTVSEKRLKAITDAREAVLETELSFVCVGTPSRFNGNLDISFLRRVCEQIGSVLREKAGYHLVVIRSTILLGTMKDVVIPVLEEFSGKMAGIDFGVCNNPEFLREGTSVHDFQHPPKTVIGSRDERSAKKLANLYEKIDAPLFITDIETAEMVKYIDNVWHALKVGFANEVGNICKTLEIDGHLVMDIFCQDRKLNISQAYLKPGFAFGGSCLPKDIRALAYKAKSLDLNLPILNAILPSNHLQIERALQMILLQKCRKISVLGFSFKAGTDDLRESPVVELIERLVGKGFDLRLYDRNVNIASLVGANRDYILNIIPHISKLMVPDLNEALAHGEVIVIGNNAPEFKDALERVRPDQLVIDLVRLDGERRSGQGYEGICW
jgi:GDP-mannose 6-dehydrogenase